jgi:hypothetical protein
VACVAGATMLLGLRLHRSHPDEKAVAAAEDQVYEVAVRDVTSPEGGRAKVSQLVFDENLLTEFPTGIDTKSCKEDIHKRMSWASEAPPYDSFLDRVYRLFTRSEINSSVTTETIKDFLEKSCISGRLSRTFHTDLPRAFVTGANVHFEGWPIDKKRTSFEELFPGAGGVIGLSRVGFDSALDEAMVSVSFVCGGLCGEGWRYFLKKNRSGWEVAYKRMVWVS